ncbi:hypothetical protein F383_18463 [Gossypium arboreum]|uniref:Uncharacterized protein n=1 Tax=Gossypium arboreum TaxID=29729 RepID=A0A0B0MF57_GOSAR|nr:hypothetical protein F383_18463 [Gossypium arboreum]
MSVESVNSFKLYTQSVRFNNPLISCLRVPIRALNQETLSRATYHITGLPVQAKP